jgi:hypothetical protein
MKRYLYPVIGLWLGGMLISCNMPRKQTEEQLRQTAARETVSAQLTQGFGLTLTALVGGDTLTVTPDQGTTTQTPITPSPTNTNPPFIPAPNTPIPCNWAGFIADVTIPDNTEIVAGSTFQKIWRLQNLGSCTWTSGYRLAYSHGDRMGAPDDVSIISGSVPPGGMVDVAVDLVAPDVAGTYQGNFMLRTPEGFIFGIGGNASQSFWVKIIVEPITATPTATGTASATPTETATTAPPDFVLSFENVHNCGGAAPYATTRVDNIGGVAFESVEITILDITAATTLYGPGTNNTPFTAGAGDCPPGASALNPGGVAYIAAYIGAAPPSGNTARETLKMCTGDGLTGDCITKSVDFVLP